jgi:hypothetical protein
VLEPDEIPLLFADLASSGIELGVILAAVIAKVGEVYLTEEDLAEGHDTLIEELDDGGLILCPE